MLNEHINEFTIDIIPHASFNPALGAYLKDVPILLKNCDALKETLCHRRKTLSANGLKIHFENSTFTKDVLLKEIYHNGAIVCLYRLETAQGETAGFYNTQTKQFVSMFTHTEEQTTLFQIAVSEKRLPGYYAQLIQRCHNIPEKEASLLKDAADYYLKK